jgi:hypothetical protein
MSSVLVVASTESIIIIDSVIDAHSSRHILIFRMRDPHDATPVAVLYPDGRITGTADPALVQTIQQALAVPDTSIYMPAHYFLQGPASRYNPNHWRWPLAVGAALWSRGLRGRPVGWTLPPTPMPPGASPDPAQDVV